jgi:hypothetical protein
MSNNPRQVRQELFRNTEKAVRFDDLPRLQELLAAADRVPCEKAEFRSWLGRLNEFFMPGYRQFARLCAATPFKVKLIDHAFSVALEKRNYMFVRQLLEAGLSPTSDQKWSFVYKAMRSGDLEALRFVVQTVKANVNDRTSFQSPVSHLDYAAEFSNLEIVQYLVQAGAAVTPCSVLEAARTGRVDVLAFLLDCGGKANTRCPRIGISTLQYVSEHRRCRNRDRVMQVLQKQAA